jgi:hypothetical protein
MQRDLDRNKDFHLEKKINFSLGPSSRNLDFCELRPGRKNFFFPGWSESNRDFCELRPGRNKFFCLDWSDRNLCFESFGPGRRINFFSSPGWLAGWRGRREGFIQKNLVPP